MRSDSYARWFLLSVLALVVIVGLVIGGWQLGWWFKTVGTNRGAHVFQQSYGAQSADFEQLQQTVLDIRRIDAQLADPSTPKAEAPALRAQRQAIVAQGCTVGSHITSPLPPPEAAFVAANC